MDERGQQVDSKTSVHSIYDLAAQWPLQGPQVAAVAKVFSVVGGQARCRVNQALADRFGVQQDNLQLVVCVTNLVTLSQAWFNRERCRKPQTFVAEVAEVVDPTSSKRPCDFCNWQQCTAEDCFGRVETEDVVTASNLFKYCQPCHGLVLFKNHNPLAFTRCQLAQLLQASRDWFWLAAAAAAADGMGPCHPFLIWNCLPRAGASQFHGHAQVMLSEVPFPAQQQLEFAAARYASAHPSSTYYDDMASAHATLGLVHTWELDGNRHGYQRFEDQALAVSPGCFALLRALCYPSLAPAKDKEVVVHGAALTCPAFAALLHVALRTLIDRLGVTSFNAAILNISLDDGGARAGLDMPPVMARIVSRGPQEAKASDFGGLEVLGSASIAHTDPFVVSDALRKTLEERRSHL